MATTSPLGNQLQLMRINNIQRLSLVLLFLIVSRQVTAADDSKFPATLQQYEEQLIQISNEVSDSVVMIAAIHATNAEKTPTERFEEIFHPEASQLPARIGMGVIVENSDNQLLVLTTTHLVEPIISRQRQQNPFDLFVKFSTNEIAHASLVAADPRSELAVLKIDPEVELKTNSNFTPVQFAETTNTVKGSILVALGDPWEMAKDGQSGLSAAIVTDMQRSLELDSDRTLAERTLHELGTLLTLDLPVRFASHGTPLFTIQGEFAGLVHSQKVFSQQGEAVSFAVPNSEGFRRIVKELKQGYEVEYGFLGISAETSSTDAFDNISLTTPQSTAAIVLRVPENSPAANAGMKRDDLILRVNDQIIETNEDLVREITLLKPSERVELMLYRDGEGTQSVTATLGKWPIYDDSLIVTTQQRHPDWRGLHVDYPTSRKRYLRDRFLSVYPTGVVIVSIEEGSIADRAGLQVGQFIVKVNGQSVETPQQFQDAVADQQEVNISLASGTEITISND
ncbi:PDZ domain-containing protein [Planctomicrobium sp.]|jgi:serine protease Do|nr:PDZ domain-containing protein [Planctomicrobium sp.]MDB4743770.1 PDZ domain-containing protein [Planctomicrobium sp.]